MGLLACSASSVTIEGKDGINRQKEYYLYGCQAGSLIPIASALIDSNGCFRLNVPLPQEGFYLLGTEQGVMHPFYLKGNETIRLRFQTNGMILEGEQTPENQALSQWEKAATLVREHAFLYERFGGGYSTDPATFTQELEDLLRVRQQLKPEKATGNATFNSLLKAKMEADVDFYALAYLQRNAGNLSDKIIQLLSKNATGKNIATTCIVTTSLCRRDVTNIRVVQIRRSYRTARSIQVQINLPDRLYISTTLFV